MTLNEKTQLAVELIKMLGLTDTTQPQQPQQPSTSSDNPFLGQYVLCRTYSAGVHLGVLKSHNGTEAHLTEAIRLWRWTNGGLSLSALATNGQKGGRNNYTGEVYLTEVIEIIPVTDKAKPTFQQWLEDVESA